MKAKKAHKRARLSRRRFLVRAGLLATGLAAVPVRGAPRERRAARSRPDLYPARYWRQESP